MKTAETLINALTADPSVRLVERHDDDRRLLFSVGPIEMLVTWDDLGDSRLAATYSILVPEPVKRLPEWQHQLGRALELLDLERGPHVHCRVVSADPCTVEVAVRVLADALTRHQLLGAVEELTKVQRLLAIRVEAMRVVASQTTELMSLVDGLTSVVPPAQSARQPFAPPHPSG